MKLLRIGTRGSALALAQTAWVKAELQARYPEATIESVIIKTSGDRFADTALQAMGGKGVFTKEIEDALLANEIDLAVHSMKDLPTELGDGLTVAAVPPREDPRDVLASSGAKKLSELSSGATIGTGSLRRRAQILHYRPDLFVVPIRGNIDTRLKKLDAGEVDALIMAAAGLKRIGREDRIAEFLPQEICVSAVAQGALALESRESDSLREQLSFLHHEVTFSEVSAERAFLRRLGGGCYVPVGARATVAGNELKIVGVVANPEGRSLYRGEVAGRVEAAAELGRELADRLLRQGADKILAAAMTVGLSDG
ncbi:MAG TPA: hydroxymethylbilane synthase [Candidatus Binatia bacterium]|nr:hydroxymethylbilane synthase [Candidatus Binatia bacterium]